MEFGDTETVSDSYQLTATEKNRIASQVPVSISLDYFLGTTTIPIRKPFRELLDNLPSPTFDADFTVEGDCEDLKSVAIECTAEEMTGTHTGQLQVAGVGATFMYRARVVPRRYTTQTCKCPGEVNGKRRERRFEIRWFLDVDINPGVGGSYKLETRFATITTPCCCGKSTRSEDRRDTGLERKSSGSESAAKPARSSSGANRKQNVQLPL